MLRKRLTLRIVRNIKPIVVVTSMKSYRNRAAARKGANDEKVYRELASCDRMNFEHVKMKTTLISNKLRSQRIMENPIVITKVT